MAKKKHHPKAVRTHQEAKRTLRPGKYKSFRLSKPKKHTGHKLPSAWHLTKKSVSFLWLHKKTLGGILLIYAIIQFILVQGVLGSNLPELKKTVDDSLGGFATGVALFSYMISSVGQTNSASASVYQSILFVIASLAIIWALRQLMADKLFRIREAYYKGMYPLIPFILVLLVIGLQTIPALVGAWLYGVVITNGIAVAVVEQLFWLIIFFIFALLSLYMICSSLFALYIVTLPDMTPMKALRSARGLVLYRRWSIARKIIVLFIILLVAAAIIMLPLIMLAPTLAPVLFYVGTILAIGFAHTYIYHIYRELLADG